jgi:hypothetical protein
MNCDLENYSQSDVCERCGRSILQTNYETFNIGTFARRNYQQYGLFGVLFALFYLIMLTVPAGLKFIGLVPLIIALYVLLLLTRKAAMIIGTKPWENNENESIRESHFDFLWLCISHILLVLTLIVIIPQEARPIAGIGLAVLMCRVYFSPIFSHEQIKRALWILLINGFCYEIFVLLILIIPILANITKNASFISSYTWFVLVVLYVTTWGLMALYFVSPGYSETQEQSTQYLSILQQERDRNSSALELFLGVVLLFGIFLLTILFSLPSLYGGL